MNNLATQLIQLFGGFSISAEKYTPANKDGLSWGSQKQIAETNAVVKKLVKLSQANIGANGWDIEVKMFRSESKNEAISWDIYKLLESYEIDKLKKDYDANISIHGNCILTEDTNGKPIIHNPSLYHLYWDTLEAKARKYALVIDGNEQKGVLGNLQHGKDLYHIKNPDSNYKPWGDSAIDASYDWILFYQHAVQANNQLASRGWINTLLLMPETDQATQQYLQSKDENGKTMAQILGDRLKDWFGGTKNASKIAILDRIKDVKEVGKSNTEMQFVQTQAIIKDQIAMAFGFSGIDLGVDSTYNTASTFNYAQYDQIGRPREQAFADYVNNYLLPKHFSIKEGLTLKEALLNGDIYYKVNEPSDPDEVAKTTMSLSIMEKMLAVSTNTEYKAKIINEFRDGLGLDPIDEALLEVEEVEPTQAPTLPQGQVVEVKAEEFAVKSPTEKALESREFLRESNGVKKGYFPHWEGKIKDQLTAYTDEIVKKNSVKEIIDSIDTDFPAITKFYKKKDMKKDLLVFAEMGYKEFLKDTKEKFASIKVPDYVQKLVDERISFLLGGTDKYEGLDAETRRQIQTILEQNLDLEVNSVITLIISKIDDLAFSRAQIVAETEVGNILEASRFKSYQESGYKVKRWLTVRDGRVRHTHNANAEQGIIPIDQAFSNGNMKAGEEPRCRCTTVYGIEERDIS